jgi:hypothetical protein
VLPADAMPYLDNEKLCAWYIGIQLLRIHKF